jgi:hypothetical protein
MQLAMAAEPTRDENLPLKFAARAKADADDGAIRREVAGNPDCGPNGK